MVLLSVLYATGYSLALFMFCIHPQYSIDKCTMAQKIIGENALPRPLRTMRRDKQPAPPQGIVSPMRDIV